MSKSEIQDEALAAVRPHERAGIGASMGSGKTVMALRHMTENYNENSTFLVVIPKLSVEKTYKEEAELHNYEWLIPHMSFTTYLSLTKEQYDYDVVYLDECHNLLATHEPWLSQYHGKILGLTGTPPKYKNSEKGKMVAKYCPIVYTYSTDTAIEDKNINDYRIIVHLLKMDVRKNMLVTKKDKAGVILKSWYTSEIASYEYWTKRVDQANSAKESQIMKIMRMKAIKEFPSKERYAKSLLDSQEEKCILFANTQEQADRLCPHSYHSKNEDSERNLEYFKSGKITRMSAVLQLNEGINVPGLKAGIMMHSYGNERKAAQRLGRLLRLNPDDVATLHVLCYEGTVDEKWVRDAFSHLDPMKIFWVRPG